MLIFSTADFLICPGNKSKGSWFRSKIKINKNCTNWKSKQKENVENRFSMRRYFNKANALSKTTQVIDYPLVLSSENSSLKF